MIVETEEGDEFDITDGVPQIETRRPTINLENAATFVKVQASRVRLGVVTDQIFEKRAAACRSCPHLRSDKKRPDPIGYCDKCGCGVNRSSALSRKLKAPALECPVGRFGAVMREERNGEKDGD